MSSEISVLIPITALLAAFSICFAALYYRFQVRKLRNSERLAAIARGIEIPEEGPGRVAWLLRGLIWIAGGFGISIVLSVLYIVHHDGAALATATVGVIPKAVGAAYLVAYRVAGARRTAGARQQAHG
jgi:hypothetical protein